MSAEIAELEVELKQYTQELKDARQSLSQNPNSQDLIALCANLEQFVELQTTAINELKSLLAPPSAPARPVSSPPPPPPDGELSDGKKGTPSQNTPVPLKVNDIILAKWLSGDRGFYDAKITAISGKSSDPVYTVAFLIDNSIGTVRKHEIQSAIKAKPDNPPSVTQPAPSTQKQYPGQSSTVPNSASDSTFPTNSFRASESEIPNPENPQSTNSATDSAQKAARKIRNKRELEEGKSSWQKFSQTKKAKVGKKKDSIFRTGDSVTARVGFTGSGQIMRKDVSRSRHTYEYNEDDD